MFYMNNKFKGKPSPKPCISCKAAAAGRPVNPIYGLKFLEKETDFAFEGILPLVWSRSYYSDQDGTGWLGEGWSVPGCQRIIRDAAGLAYIDDQGRLFPLPEVDEDDEEPVLFESEQIWFSKNPDGHYVIASLDGSIALRFAPLVVAEDGSDEDSTLFPLVAVEDANGNHQRFVYHPLTGLPQYVIDGNGRVFSLNFGNVADGQSPKMRLLSVSLLEGLPVFGEAVRVGSPLVRYEYNSSGDLLRVIGRNGKVKRSFGYKNNLMVSHTDAAGLVSEYEYDHYTPTGKVLRNWTSLGEEWRFTYHDGYTEVTDVLGRTEQYHYDYNNELTKRVFADGSAVLMERDGLGRLLSHTDAMGRVTRYQYSNEGQVEAIVRPDGAILHFDYDDCYRLIRKSDAEGRYDGYTYDEAGNLLTHTDPLKHTTRFEYVDPDSYEPLAQVRDWTTEEGESKQEINYFHCDQIGIPREMTDKDGNLLWFGNYTGWGRLKEETRVTDSAYQPFRLQNQYADRETGLRYNLLRFYDSISGRFINQDPIRSFGGENFYHFAFNAQSWIDPLGLEHVESYKRHLKKKGTKRENILLLQGKIG
ncbi:DUF6531 domain-containing protein [Rothia aeria]|nr:DUF6531 domain-containing protein [Rothia aeria]